MRRILIAVGSGVKGGNTDRLCDAFMDGARKAGHQVEKVFLGDLTFQGCRGCGACQLNGGKCVVRDDLQAIYPMIEAADTIVLASPLYFWTISGRLKSFVDRFYAFSVEDRYPHKDAMLLMTAGDDHEWTFDRAIDYYRFLCKALGWTNLGEITAGGCKGEAKKRTIADSALDAAKTTGLEMKDIAEENIAN